MPNGHLDVQRGPEDPRGSTVKMYKACASCIGSHCDCSPVALCVNNSGARQRLVDLQL